MSWTLPPTCRCSATAPAASPPKAAWPTSRCQAKWRFYDNKQGWSLALRPAVTLPTGSDSKGLGNGRATAGATLISTLEAGDWTWLANAGYTFNDNFMTLDRIDDRLEKLAASNPNMTLMIVVSAHSPHGKLVELLDRCAKNNIRSLSVVSSPQ